MCAKSGSNGCVAYRSMKAKMPHRQTAKTLDGEARSPIEARTP